VDNPSVSPRNRTASRAQIAQMATIPWNVYRIGDQIGPGLELIRLGLDVAVIRVSGMDWVLPNTGGVSTRLWPHPLRNPHDRWWVLRAGTTVPASLSVFCNGRNHVSWEPAYHMLLGDYVNVLGSMNGQFV
jgi:hypothetical protein